MWMISLILSKEITSKQAANSEYKGKKHYIYFGNLKKKHLFRKLFPKLQYLIRGFIYNNKLPEELKLFDQANLERLN